ncbi:hypothetical protein [Nonomuraea sp. NPDC046570]|uniref:hypothetical protein n=1 Tax=Nonomuraea sp. NPDC046570 TaxID=3155255 RepID=UPI003409389B
MARAGLTRRYVGREQRFTRRRPGARASPIPDPIAPWSAVGGNYSDTEALEVFAKMEGR